MPMRTSVSILSVLLVLWIAGAAHWYVCRIRGDCKCCPGRELSVKPDTVSAAEKALRSSVEEAEKYLTNAGKNIIYFEPSASRADMSTLPPGFISSLKLYLDNTPGSKVCVTGHTDVSGNREINVKLSRQRTDFVTAYLVSAGIKAEQIMSISKVNSEPAAPDDTREGRTKNRRAEIYLLK